MSSLLTCRICLACDVCMYSIARSPLQEIYESLMNLPLETDDGRPKTVCYICYYQLKKCYKFKQKSTMSNQILVRLANTGMEISQKSLSVFVKECRVSWSLTITPMESLSSVQLDLKTESPVKQESLKMEDQVTVSDKEEDVSTAEPLELSNVDYDSEDEIPLQKMSKKNCVVKKKRRERNVAGDTIGASNTSRVVPDCKEIILSREEQLQEMLERSKSQNYLNSPFKCGLCYKGFIDTRAYENHQEKHHERSGPFSCEVCHMRYRTVRLMRTHSATSHGRQFVCNKCGHRAHTKNQARDHERWHSGYTYECQLCGQKFRKPTSYLTHMRKRHPTEHVCNICGESFVSRHGLTMHKRKAHRRDSETGNPESPSQYCAECNIHFASIEAWAKHVMTSLKHTLAADARSTCLICGTEVTSGSLQTHLKQHTEMLRSIKSQKRPKLNIVKVTCDLCGQDFVNRSKLQAHVKRIHLGKKYDKNIVCEICGKKCTSNASLKYHQRTHTGERPFPCPVCPKRFPDRNQLTIHSRSHSGQRPYQCPACPKRFTQRPALNRHCRVHTGAKPYDCQFCSKNFSQSNSLKIHVNTVHLKLPSKKKAQAADIICPPDKMAATQNGG